MKRRKKSYTTRLQEILARIEEYRLDPIKEARYKEAKERYEISNYTMEDLLSYGANIRGIYRYYKREEQLYTGEYDIIRTKQAFDNYSVMLDNATTNKELKDLMKDIIKSIPKSKRVDVFKNDITPFPMYYTLKNVGGRVVDSEIEDNIGEILERTDLFTPSVYDKFKERFDTYMSSRPPRYESEYKEFIDMIYTSDDEYDM